MRALLWTTVLGVSIGCSGGGDDTPDDGKTPGGEGPTTEEGSTPELPELPTCEQSLSDTHPDDGEAAAYYRTTVEFWLLDAAEDGHEIAVADDGGAAVPGSTDMVLTDAGEVRVVFTADDGLEPLTDYTATLTSPGCDDETLSFTTSEVGAPVSADDLLGRAWSFRLHEARWVQPAGLGAILQTMNIELMIGVVGVDGDLLDVVAATSEVGGDTQELCVPTVPFDDPVDYGLSPFFSAGPTDLLVDMGGFGIDIDGMVVTGAFSPDATRIEGATLEGLIDLRPLVPSLTIAEDAAELCAVLDLASIECGPCLDGEPYCLDAVADSLLGVEDDPIVVRTIDDVLADPYCQ